MNKRVDANNVRIAKAYMMRLLWVFAVVLCFSNLVQYSYAALPVIMGDSGSDVRSINTTQLLDIGNLTISIYDDAVAGNLVYENNFTDAISNGSWNVMLYNVSLDYGRTYYKDYSVNGDDLDFEGQERLPFTSPLGEINITSNITLGQKILFALGALIQNVLPGWINIDSNVNISNDLEVNGAVRVAGNLTIGGVGVCLADGTNCLANASGNTTYIYNDTYYNVTNNITNNITYNITNNITSEYYTNITNNITNNITQNITYNITNNITNDYYTNITNNVTQNITYNITNNITNNLTQNITNNITQNITNNVTQNITYNITQNITYNITNNITNNYSSGIFTLQSLNTSYVNIANGSTSNITINLSGFDSRYLLLTDQRFNDSSRLDSLNTSKLNVSDQRFNDSASVSSVDSRVTSVNSSVQSLVTSNTSTNSRIDSLNTTKLNVSDQRFNETAAISSVNATAQSLITSNTSTNARIDSLNTSKSGINSSQCSAGQYISNVSLSTSGVAIICSTPAASGGTYTVQSLNTSYINVANGTTMNITINLTGFDSRYLQLSDQRFNDSARIDSLNSSKLNATDQRFNDTSLVNTVDSRVTSVNSSVQSLLTSNTSTNSRIDSLNTSKLNVTDQRFNDSARVDSINLTVTALVTSNTSTNSRIDSVNSTAVGKVSPGSCAAGYVVQNTTASGVQCVLDAGAGGGFNAVGSLELYNSSTTIYFNQTYNNNTIRTIAGQYNETSLISSVNTTTNMQVLGFNTTTQLDSRYSLKGEYSNVTNNITNNVTQNITNNFTVSNSSYQCSGSDKIMNVSIINGSIIAVCQSDQTGGVGGSSTVQSLNESYINVVNGSTTNITVNLSGFKSYFDGLYVSLSNLVSLVGNWSADKPNYNTTVQLMTMFLNISDQRYNESSGVSSVNSTVQSLITSNTSTNSRIDSLNSSKLNVSDQRFNDTSLINAVDSRVSSVNSSVQSLVTSNTSTNSRIDSLNTSKLNVTDQRFNETARVDVINSSVQSLLTSNTSTNSRVDSVNASVQSLLTSNTSTNSRIDSLNSSKLNVSDQRFNDSASVSSVNSTVQSLLTSNTSTNSRVDSVNSSVQSLLTSNTSTNSRIDSVNTTKLNVSDQRFNDTSLVNAVNTSSNIKVLGFNLTTELKSYFDGLYVSLTNLVSAVGNWSLDKPNYNTTVQLQTLFLNQSDQRFNETSLVNTVDSRVSSVNSSVQSLLTSNTSTNSRIDSVNSTAVAKASTGSCADGYVVQNTTSSGVQCAPIGVINNSYYNVTIPGFNVTGSPELYNSSTTLYFNQTYNNNTIAAIVTNMTTVQTEATYTMISGGVTMANGSIIMDLFNAAGSGKIIRILDVTTYSRPTAAITGIRAPVEVIRTTTVGTGGTAISAGLFDSNDSALPAQITARTGPTGGAAPTGNIIGGSRLATEEGSVGTGAIGSFPWLQSVSVLYANNGLSPRKRLVLREGEGISCSWGNVAGTPAGLAACEVTFQIGDAYPNELPTYSWVSNSTATGTKKMIDIFNNATSGKVLKITRIVIYAKPTAAITGRIVPFEVYRTSDVGTGGTTITADKYDTQDSAVPSQITARDAPTGGATISGGAIIANVVGSDETADSEYGGFGVTTRGSNAQYLWDGETSRRPLTIREGEGLTIQTGPLSGAGNMLILVEGILE